MEAIGKNYLLNELYGIKTHILSGNKEVAEEGIDKVIKLIREDY